MTGVAVVIPCFNLGPTLEEALASIRAQSHPAAELIVVDDGSDDLQTRARLSRLSGDGIRVVRTENRGVAAARNLGVSLTSAPYIVLLDADDALEPSYIERLAGVLDQSATVDFVTCALQAFGDADYVWTPPECSWVQTLARGGPHISTMFRRTLWRALQGFDSSLDGYEDMDFWLSALERRHVGVVLPEPLLRYRVRAGSRYQQAIMGPRYLATMQAIYRKHPPRTAAEGRDLLIEKEAFLAEQRAYQLELVRRHGDTEREIAGVRQAIAEVTTCLDAAGADRVDWGDLRRTAPISPVWGIDRGKPVDRRYIEDFLDRHRSDIKGHVLEVKDAGYTRLFGGSRVTHGDVIDVEASNPLATVIADLSAPETVPADRYDCFIFTQTLQYIYETRTVLENACRLLKPGGVLLCTIPCVSRVNFEDKGLDGDFWRFTPAAALALFAEQFPLESVEVHGYGNRLVCAAFLHGLAVDELRQDTFDTHDPAFPLICSIRAVKPQPSTRGAAHRRGLPSERPSMDKEDAALVLLYHRVGCRAPDVHDLSVDREDFRGHMQHLRDHFCVRPLDELVDRTLDGSVPPRAVAVTFDDGYLENLEVVSPILLDIDIPATFFVNTDRLDEEHECWWDVLERVLISTDELPPVLDLFSDGRWVRPTSSSDERLAAHRALVEQMYASTANERSAIVDRVVQWSGRDTAPRRTHRPMTERRSSSSRRDRATRLVSIPSTISVCHGSRFQRSFRRSPTAKPSSSACSDGASAHSHIPTAICRSNRSRLPSMRASRSR